MGYNKTMEWYKETKEYKEFKQEKKWKRKQKEKKKGKKPKDENSPKRPATPFFLYLREERPKVEKKYPNKKITDIAQICGEQWHKLDEEKKKKYIEKSEILKKEYDKKLTAYRETDDYVSYCKRLKL